MNRKANLFAWGANSHGQLGLGNVSEEEKHPKVVRLDLDLSGIKSICGGGGHTIILNEFGEMYSSGWNSKGQLGYLGNSYSFKRITHVEGYKIVQVACGWDFSAAITDNGMLLVWGSNEYQQLGLAKQLSKIVAPICLNISGVKQVACGLRHMAVVLESGKVLVCGQNRHGQLGCVTDLPQPIRGCSFTQLPDVDNVKSVSCGQNFTVILTEDGCLLGLGNNKHGQLGLDPALCPKQLTPAKILVETDVKSVGTGWSHTVVLDQDGQIFNFGRNCFQQLGTTRAECWRPQRLNCEPVESVCVGSEHNVALTRTKQLLTWGWNEHGNCANSTTAIVHVPQRVLTDYTVRLIGTGGAHSFALV